MPLKHRLLKPLEPQDRYVAVLDILGFRHIVENNDTTALIDLLAHLRDITTVATGFIAERVHGARVEVEFVQYSDSFLLYTRGTSPLELDMIIRAAAGVIGGHLLWGVMLRGAIVRGDLFVSGNRQVVAGKALVHGHDLERELDWAGVILDTGTIASIEERRIIENLEMREGWIMKHEVPWKDGSRAGLAVGWPFWVTPKGAKHCRNQVLDLMGRPDTAGARKQRHAWNFYRAHRRRFPKEPFPTRATMGPDDRRRFGILKRKLDADLQRQKAEARALGMSNLDYLAMRMRKRLDEANEGSST